MLTIKQNFYPQSHCSKFCVFCLLKNKINEIACLQKRYFSKKMDAKLFQMSFRGMILYSFCTSNTKCHLVSITSVCLFQVCVLFIMKSGNWFCTVLKFFMRSFRSGWQIDYSCFTGWITGIMLFYLTSQHSDTILTPKDFIIMSNSPMSLAVFNESRL